MTADVDICNRALAEVGARSTITSLSDPSPEAVNCAIQYTTLRQQLLRAAPWGFGRKTAPLSLLGSLTDVPPAAPYPWMYKYAYPADCLKVRYILWMPPEATNPAPLVGEPLFASPWMMPSRNNRFLVANDDTVGPQRRVILSNVQNALAVYTLDVTNPDLWDPLFDNALVMLLANKLIIPLSGNVNMKNQYLQQAMLAVSEARAMDGNEAMPSVDHTPDWIMARGDPISWNGGWPWVNTLGQWYSGWDNVAWGN